MLSCVTAFGQYEYFNNVYIGLNGGPFMFDVFVSDPGYLSVGLKAGGLEWRSVDQFGSTIENSSLEEDDHSFYVGDNPRDCLIKCSSGYITSFDSLYGPECSTATHISGCVFLNNSFQEQWHHTFSQWNVCDTLENWTSSFCHVDDSTFAMLSSFFYANGQPFHPDSSGWRITRMKYSTGEVLEDHAMVQPNHIYAMRQIRYVAGNYFILGYAVPFQGTTQNPGDEQTLIYKVSPNGDILGQVELGNPNHCYERYPQMEVTNDDKLLIFYDYCIDMYPNPFSEGWFKHISPRHVQLNPIDMQLTDEIVYSLPNDDQWLGGISHICVVVDANSDYLVNDFYTSHDAEIPTIENALYHGNVITKFNQMGEIIWQQQYFSDDYGAPYYSNTALYDMIQTPDGGYLCTGVSYNDFDQKHWLLKIDNCGYEQPSGCPAVVGVDENNIPLQLQLWPNPFYNLLKAVLPQNASRVFITDMTGRIVHEEKVYYPNQQFDVSQLATGVYLFNVECDDGRVLGERVVKR